MAQLKKASRNANFSLSGTATPAFSNETSAGQAFTAGKLNEQASTHIGQVQNMRVANFSMGHAPSAYGTTSDHNNRFASAGPGKALDFQAQRDRVARNRMPHYDFGRDPVNYQSTAKNEYHSHDLGQAVQAKQERAENARDVRKSHFLLGTDSPSHMSHKITPSSTKAGGDRTIVSAMFRQPEQNAAAGTNIQIYHKGVAAGSNRFTSSYKSSNSLQVAPVKLTQKASFLDKKRSG
jgi:hypothetical protein